VEAKAGESDYGNNLKVKIELEVLSAMPAKGPQIEVSATCGSESDSQSAFLNGLNSAKPNQRKVDTITLLNMNEPATKCELTLSLSNGATPPAHYCFLGNKTTVGRCP
jgi:hypothetical protein